MRLQDRERCMMQKIKKRNNADKLKEKLKWKLLLKGERRWQHREETMATNRERDDIEADSGQDYKYRRFRWWFHRQQFRARELAIDEA
ncbi:uncharacterized protein OCT59_008638 [Rhizophagus irregularis]|uniref:uncharacterized protein n=1 Tax=Rhizophagus irregularis TaxID=588596 RepID=UPI003328D27D|nr:hypothetical protein OCT59_008638 [Rhizophagus irregularis]